MSSCESRTKLFLALAPRKCRDVRMCKGIQTDNAGEIARSDWESQWKGAKKKIKKRGQIYEKKKIQTIRRRDTGIMRSKGRARKLAMSRCMIPSFFPFEFPTVTVITACINAFCTDVIFTKKKRHSLGHLSRLTTCRPNVVLMGGGVGFVQPLSQKAVFLNYFLSSLSGWNLPDSGRYSGLGRSSQTVRLGCAARLFPLLLSVT